VQASRQTATAIDTRTSPTRGPAGSPGLAERAYLNLRDAIIAIELKPGEPLDEKVLSGWLDVGLTPVREAIKRLNRERLAVIYPRRGSFVADINVSDERWVTETRVELEGLAAALAAERATEEQCASMRELVAKLRRHEKTPDISVDYLAVDTEIHRQIYAAAQNPYLESTLNEYLNLAVRIWHYGLQRRQSRIPLSCAQDEVVRVISAHDPVAARIAAQNHLRGYSAEVRSLL
jgi:DNA-binding GntR family transcriptional regulator